jgi:hypothetical protein
MGGIAHRRSIMLAKVRPLCQVAFVDPNGGTIQAKAGAWRECRPSSVRYFELNATSNAVNRF